MSHKKYRLLWRRIWISSKEDLIISKLLWARDTGSEIQLRDVVNLMRSGFDDSYVSCWVDKFELETNYAHCAEQLGK